MAVTLLVLGALLWEGRDPRVPPSQPPDAALDGGRPLAPTLEGARADPLGNPPPGPHPRSPPDALRVAGDPAPVLVEVLARGTDQPIEGALVCFVSVRGEVASSDRVAQTDALGVATVPRGPDCSFLGVWANGFLPYQRSHPVEDGASPVRVHLDPGAMVSVRVVDTEGAPLPGAWVRCFTPANRVGWLSPGGGSGLQTGRRGVLAHARTGVDGVAVVKGLWPDAPHSVWASLPGWTPRVPFQELRPGAPETTLTLVPVYGLVLHFVNERTGQSIHPVRPLFTWSLPAQTLPVPFHFAVLHAGLEGDAPAPAEPMVADSAVFLACRVVPMHEGPPPRGREAQIFVDVRCPGFRPTREPIQLHPARTVRTTIRLEETRQARGRVRFAAAFPGGAPYTGAVTVSMSTGHAREQELELELEFEDGMSDPVDLPVGSYSVRARGWMRDPRMTGEWWTPAAHSSSLVLVPDEGEVLHRLVLRGAQVELEVVDALGEPVRGFDLAVSFGGPEPARVWMWDVYQVARTGRRTAAAAPRVWLPPGFARLHVESPGQGSGEATVHVGEEGGTHHVRIRLSP